MSGHEAIATGSPTPDRKIRFLVDRADDDRGRNESRIGHLDGNRFAGCRRCRARRRVLFEDGCGYVAVDKHRLEKVDRFKIVCDEDHMRGGNSQQRDRQNDNGNPSGVCAAASDLEGINHNEAAPEENPRLTPRSVHNTEGWTRSSIIRIAPRDQNAAINATSTSVGRNTRMARRTRPPYHWPAPGTTAERIAARPGLFDLPMLVSPIATRSVAHR